MSPTLKQVDLITLGCRLESISASGFLLTFPIGVTGVKGSTTEPSKSCES